MRITYMGTAIEDDGATDVIDQAGANGAFAAMNRGGIGGRGQGLLATAQSTRGQRRSAQRALKRERAKRAKELGA